MNPTPGRAGHAVLAALFAAVLLLTGCAPPAVRTQLPAAGSPPAATPTQQPDTQDCGDPTLSYPPDPGASGPALDRIRQRGTLVVGVSADSVPLGYRDPLTGQLQGFDIDLARAVAGRLLGSPEKVQYRVITAGERIPLLQDGDVDMVVRLMTVTCARWEQVAFSQVYYEAGQKVLVRTQPGAPKPATTLKELAGRKARVCAPAGTSSYNRLAEPQYAGVVAVPASTHTGCLVLFQRGEVDAITGDDTVLAGLAQQDPYAAVTTAPKLSSEPYGIAFNKDDEELVAYVNALLGERATSGEWTASYDRWLREALGPGTPPANPTTYRQ